MKINKLINLKIEHYDGNTHGIATSQPRISWQYSSFLHEQASVELSIEHGLPGDHPQTENIIVDATKNVLLQWPIKSLEPRENVKIAGRLIIRDEEQEWSKPLRFDVGLLNKLEIAGTFIGINQEEGNTDYRKLPVLIRKFHLDEAVSEAKLYLSALGLVECRINGRKVGTDILNPGWTDYNQRVECWTYDVQSLLKTGDNVLEFLLADGWYRGRIGFYGGNVNYYGKKLGLFVQLEMINKSGESLSISSNSWDQKWFWSWGPIIQSGLCEGETYDARKKITDYSDAALKSKKFQSVSEVKFDVKKLEFPILGPVVADGEHRPQRITKLNEKDGITDWLIDFGQNCTQRVVLDVSRLKKNDEITLQHVEVLNPDGSIATVPLRRGLQIDHYIADGMETTYESIFTIHGFRYVQLKGWRGELSPENIKTIVYHSKMKKIGSFKSADPIVNKLHENIEWSLKSNFVSIPTDCPQRDERLGWTGDITLFAPTANYLYDVHGFLSNWLEDLDYEQRKYGTMPFWVPYLPLREWDEPSAIAIWGDSAVFVPWSIYMASGDKRSLEKQFPAAEQWVSRLETVLSEDGVWDKKPKFYLGQLGDWLDPSAPADNPVKAMTQKELVATAFYARSCSLLAQIALELGDLSKHNKYQKLFEHVRHGYQTRYFTDNGIMTSDTETAYALSISFNLIDDPDVRLRAGNRLALLVRSADGKIKTGFAGTPYVLPALCLTNHEEEAIKLFKSEKCPSWLYQVKMGATTTWERWDSMRPDGSMNSGEMTSFNHYALGSVANWMHSYLGGMSPMKPGWKKIRFSPIISSELTSASTTHVTPNGLASIDWDYDAQKKIHIKLTVPNNTIGVLELSGIERQTLMSGDYQFDYQLD